ncbi:MAG: hypothetical protein ABIK61_05750 [candidate division WOR-3 bacterium]
MTKIKRYQNRTLTDDYLLFLDGVWVKVNNGQRVVKKALLIVYVIRVCAVLLIMPVAIG